MCAVAAQGLDVGEAQALDRDAELEQAKVLGDGKVFAIALAELEGFFGGGPVIVLASGLLVTDISDRAVDQVVHGLQLG